MNVPVMEMNQDEAKAKVEALVRSRCYADSKTYRQALIDAHQAMADGFRVVDVGRVFRNVKRFDNGLPRIAFARSDAKQVKCEVSPYHETIEFDARRVNWTTRNTSKLQHFVSGGRSPYFTAGYSLVPPIPPEIRPKGQLKSFFTLFEVEEWADRRIGARVDPDPYLLKHIAGTIYAIVAEWDLSPLEMALFAGQDT